MWDHAISITMSWTQYRWTILKVLMIFTPIFVTDVLQTALDFYSLLMSGCVSNLECTTCVD